MITNATLETIYWHSFSGHPKGAMFREEALTFTDKASYLEWVAAWKTHYNQLATDIRGFKRARKLNAEPYKGHQEWSAHTQRNYYRQLAHAMIIIRHASKRKSAEQREQQRIGS